MPASLGRCAALIALVAFTVGGCGSGGDVGAPAAESPAVEQSKDEDGPEFGYEVYLQGMLTDTLRGTADFGLVFEPQTRREYWVLSLRSGGDVTSGVYLSRPDTSRPSVGTYEIRERPPLGKSNRSPPVDDRRAAEGFSMIYRVGMQRAFVSTSGTLELTTATDTLLEGNFQTTLRGIASQPGEPPQKGQIRARGSFRAERAVVGFIFGI